MGSNLGVVNHRNSLFCFGQAAHSPLVSLSWRSFQTQGKVSDSTGKDNRSTADMMPFLLPPIGLVILGTITGLVISIRKWQKIPSLPTQGRLDIKDVQASAARAGGMRTPPGGSKEMKTPWGP